MPHDESELAQLLDRANAIRDRSGAQFPDDGPRAKASQLRVRNQAGLPRDIEFSAPVGYVRLVR